MITGVSAYTQAKRLPSRPSSSTKESNVAYSCCDQLLDKCKIIGRNSTRNFTSCLITHLCQHLSQEVRPVGHLEDCLHRTHLAISPTVKRTVNCNNSLKIYPIEQSRRRKARISFGVNLPSIKRSICSDNSDNN